MNLFVHKRTLKGPSAGMMKNDGISMINKDEVNRFLGGLLHDYNNLLMCIMGNSSLMLHKMEKDDPHYKRIKQIEQCVERGMKVTEKILRFMD